MTWEKKLVKQPTSGGLELTEIEKPNLEINGPEPSISKEMSPNSDSNSDSKSDEADNNSNDIESYQQISQESLEAETSSRNPSENSTILSDQTFNNVIAKIKEEGPSYFKFLVLGANVLTQFSKLIIRNNTYDNIEEDSSAYWGIGLQIATIAAESIYKSKIDKEGTTIQDAILDYDKNWTIDDNRNFFLKDKTINNAIALSGIFIAMGSYGEKETDNKLNGEELLSFLSFGTALLVFFNALQIYRDKHTNQYLQTELDRTIQEKLNIQRSENNIPSTSLKPTTPENRVVTNNSQEIAI